MTETETDTEAETTTIDGDEYVAVAGTDEIPDGRGIAVDVGGIEVAVFNADGEFYAIGNRCAHQRAPLCQAGSEKINADHTWTKTRGRVDAEECTVSCPWHLWKFDLETGLNEASGKRVASFDAAERDGTVYVHI